MRRTVFIENWPVLLAVVGWAAMLAIATTLPRKSEVLDGGSWFAWQLTPGVSVPLLLVGALYVAGAWRGSARRGAIVRHLAFAGGLLAFYVALQSPIESLADHSLAIHEVEHMLLRTIGPMLLVLAEPQACLLRGMPGWLRRRVVTPVMSARATRLSFGVLSRPLVATTLFVGVSAFWMLPKLHDLALVNEDVHWWMHLSLVFCGVLFFVRLFDQRHPPLGPSLPARLLMCWFAVGGAILIGFTITFSPRVLYPAYQASGLAWGLSPKLNEIYGGQTAWIPGSMMLIVALLTMVYRWAQQEDRTAVRGIHVEKSVVVIVAEQRSRNRALAVGLAGIAVMVFGLVFASALAYRGM